MHISALALPIHGAYILDKIDIRDPPPKKTQGGPPNKLRLELVALRKGSFRNFELNSVAKYLGLNGVSCVEPKVDTYETQKSLAFHSASGVGR